MPTYLYVRNQTHFCSCLNIPGRSLQSVHLQTLEAFTRKREMLPNMPGAPYGEPFAAFEVCSVRHIRHIGTGIDIPIHILDQIERCRIWHILSYPGWKRKNSK